MSNRDDFTELLRSLERHVPRDEKETRDLAVIIAHVRRGGDPFDRASFSPGHLTGSAFVLDSREERLLMLHHARLDRWLQPGGHGEPGETDPLEVALREAREETGIHGLVPHPGAPRPFDLDVHRIPAKEKNGKPIEPAHDHLDVRYVLLAPALAVPAVSGESRAIEWRPLAEAASSDADPALLRAIGKLRALAARRS
ncbi:NUDIX hydrolase [bacterium]|nr:NUDIX hydrolase [bacterium]